MGGGGSRGSRSYQQAWRMHERYLGAILKRMQRGKGKRRVADDEAGTGATATQPQAVQNGTQEVVNPI